jgi:hypothetical protein
MGGRDVVSLAVRYDNRVVRGVALLDRPGGALANADERAKRDRDCQAVGSSPNFQVGSAALSFGVAQRR